MDMDINSHPRSTHLESIRHLISKTPTDLPLLS
jgi:hypothetical protein